MPFLRRLALTVVLLLIFILLDIATLIQMTLSLLFGSGRRGWRVALSKDQLGNVFVGGHEDELFSSRCWRMRGVPRYDRLRVAIDWLFLKLANEEDHCRNAYEKELRSCEKRFS